MGISLGLLVQAALPLLAQPPAPTAEGSIVLCGATLRIGMERDEAMHKVSASCDVKPFSPALDPEQRRWHLYSRAKPHQEIGELSFASGALVVASKIWARDTETAGLLDAVFFAAGTVSAQGGHSCAVASAYKDEPGQSFKMVTIVCGRKQAVLSFGRAGRVETWSVTEDLR